MVQEGTKGESEIILDVYENEVELKPTREVVLPIASHTHFNALDCPNLNIAANINKEALL